jgi:hypothetical protein
MLEIALSEAAKTTIAYIAIWFVIQARGEKEEYEEMRRSRRR